MGKIHELGDALSNKIAAGEVVERPASVVKELVENAVDAGSTVIDILVKEAGLEEIRIIDNGSGIEHEDVLTAFKRHATSKIHNEDDLFRVRTLGFRGEALPSIASVSKVKLQTCSESETEGTEVVLEGGKVISFERARARKGTDLSVQELFYNTPARLKYMKTLHTELGHITDAVSRLALCNPHISFRLVHNERKVLQTSGNGDPVQVLASIYGVGIAKNMVKFQASSLDFEVTGYMAKPENTRASRHYMTIIVNGRFIRNHAIQKAILDGFHTFLPIGRYPICLLDIKMDPLLADVNVHPSKLEVRFSKERDLMDQVTAAIRSQWRKETLIPSAVSAFEKREQKAVQTTIDLELPSENAKSTVGQDSFSTHIEGDSKGSTGSVNLTGQRKEELDNGLINELVSQPAFVKEEESSLEKTAEEVARWKDEMEEKVPASSIEVRSPRIPPLYYVGQAHGTYIIAQNDEGLYLIDQHAAQERLKYEFYRVKVQEVANDVQDLLIPLTLEYAPDDFIKIKENQNKLEAAGVFLEEFGMNSFIIRSHPTWFPKGEEKETIEEMIEQLLNMNKISIEKIREEAAILMSCKGSIKANRYLRQEEIETLLHDLRYASDPFTCPHGRPIIIKFTTYELEKMFKRVM
ncbi:DNA mismatch repair protein MutL [Bacillus oleivorans]|uniref:DNA mismatch repair protein MutL n=1 Tax=Bacillus oleivorans TaxID=1448271 RepID=A0A285D6F3_9BACI|nr:DNA mismatch repair endonuclease MutL [Bacillus oleivorans]SNX75387.1 DNA mismatch repair protein MutL [Bacillus oleivorans]